MIARQESALSVIHRDAITARRPKHVLARLGRLSSQTFVIFCRAFALMLARRLRRLCRVRLVSRTIGDLPGEFNRNRTARGHAGSTRCKVTLELSGLSGKLGCTNVPKLGRKALLAAMVSMSRNEIGISRRTRQWHHVLSAITANCIPLETCRAGGRGEEKRERERERERGRRGEINFISGEYFHGYLFRESARPGVGAREEGGGTRRTVDDAMGYAPLSAPRNGTRSRKVEIEGLVFSGGVARPF